MPDPGTCTNFQFQVMDQTANSIGGSVHPRPAAAACRSRVQVRVRLNGNAVTVAVRGNATGSLFPGGLLVRPHRHRQPRRQRLHAASELLRHDVPRSGSRQHHAASSAAAGAASAAAAGSEPEPRPTPPSRPSAPDGFDLNAVRYRRRQPEHQQLGE